MKRKKKLLALLSLCSLLAACSHIPTSYETLASTEQAVDIGYRAYMDLVVQGTVSTNNVPVVARAYNDFQAALTAAVVLSQSNTNAPASQAVLDAAATILTTITKEEAK